MFVFLESSLFPILYTLVTGYSFDKFILVAIVGAVSGGIYDYMYWIKNSYEITEIKGKKYLWGFLALIPIAAFFTMYFLLNPILGISAPGIFRILQLLEIDTLSIYQRMYISVMAFLPAVSGMLSMRYIIYPLLDRVSDFYDFKDSLVGRNKFWTPIGILLLVLLIPLCILKGIYRGVVNIIAFYYKSFKENIV